MIPTNAVSPPVGTPVGAVGIGDVNIPGLANGGAGISPIGNPMVNRPPGAQVGPAPSGAPAPQMPPNLGAPLRVGPGMGQGARPFGDRGNPNR